MRIIYYPLVRVEESELQSFELIASDGKVIPTMLTAVADKRLESLLIGMSLVDRSDSTIAVQQALYALIALRIYGSKIALSYKLRAINALRNSMRKGLVAKDGLQHIATGLLLSLYEVSFTSKTTCCDI